MVCGEMTATPAVATGLFELAQETLARNTHRYGGAAMTAIVDLFSALLDSGLLVAAFIIGAIVLVLAIIGRIPGFTPGVTLSGRRTLALGVLGLFLMAFGIGGFLISSLGDAGQKPTVDPTKAALPSKAEEPSVTAAAESTPAPTEAPEESGPSSAEVTQPGLTTSATDASITSGQLAELRSIEDVQSAINQAEKFAGFQQNDYREGDTIPADVLIATNLHSTDLESFGVEAINNQGGWGLFLTTREFVAPNPGTYWCIR